MTGDGMRRKLKVLPISLLLIILPIIAIMTITSTSDAVGEPDIVVTIAQPKQTAYVKPGQDGILTFTGTVEADIPWAPSFQYLIVELSADAGGWPVSNPPALIFSRQTTMRSFSLSVQVPIGTSSTIQRDLVITGRWSYSPGVLGGNIPPSTAIIVVDWYSQFDISSKDPIVEAERDDRVVMSLLVENEGNSNDRISLEIENIDDLADEGITPILADYSVSVEEGETGEAKLYIETDKRTGLDTYAIDIVAESEKCKELGQPSPTDRFTVYVDVVSQKKVTEPETEPEPEPEEEPQTPEEPEPEPELEPETEEIDNDSGGAEPIDTTVDNDTSSSSNTTLIFVILAIIIILLAGLCLGVYFFIRNSNGRKDD